MAEKYLFVHSVAAKLNCSARYVYRLIETGDLKAIRIGVRALRVPEAALEEFIRRGNGDKSERLGL